MTQKEALAKYLRISVNDLVGGYNESIFEAPDGSEYVVTTHDVAEELAKQQIIDLFDEIGINSFTKKFQDWIKLNALDDDDYFEEALRESAKSYVSDLEYDTYGQSIYPNRLIEELVDIGILTDEDFETNSEGEPMYDELLDTVDLETCKSEYVEILVDSEDDPVDWFIDAFGEESINDLLKSKPSMIDMDKVAREAIRLDGVAHFIAGYDNKEIKLGDGLFAYRIN